MNRKNVIIFINNYIEGWGYSCSSNEFVIFNERKLHEISMKLQVAIFVTIQKPEIRGGGASS